MIKIADPIIKDDEINAVIEVMKSGRLARGKKVEHFEFVFSGVVGNSYGIATNSGTSALHTALLACGVEPGDEVIVPAFSFFSTASVVSMCGAIPIFTDVDMNGLMDVASIESMIGPSTKAIIGVHLYGRVMNGSDLVYNLCKDYDLKFIVDSCQAPNNFDIICDAACYSFYATKNVMTGEGGMITTDDSEIDAFSRRIIDHGQMGKYYHTNIGYNYRMTDLSAAIGMCQIKRLDEITKRRREIAGKYIDGLKDIGSDILQTPEMVDNHVFHQFVIQSPYRSEITNLLQRYDIETAVHYPIPIPYQPVYRKYYRDISIPVSNRLSKRVLSIPCHPGLTDQNVDYVIEKLHLFEKFLESIY